MLEGAASLRERIAAGRATIGIVGLGYVGLPLLVAASHSGFPVVGFDVDRSKIERLRSGGSYVPDVDGSELGRLANARFEDDPAALRDAEVLVVCVPTPLRQNTPDLSLVRRAAELVAEQIEPGRLVILE